LDFAQRLPKLFFIDQNAEYLRKLVRLQIATVFEREDLYMSRGVEIVTNLEKSGRNEAHIIFSELILSLSFVM